MSGFGQLFAEAAGLLALAAIVGMVVGWSFGALRASRTTTERYEQQIRATLRRMSDAEAEAVTLRGRLEERSGVIAAQQREHESQEHLLAALEARLAEAEGAAEDARKATKTVQAARRLEPRQSTRPLTRAPDPKPTSGDAEPPDRDRVADGAGPHRPRAGAPDSPGTSDPQHAEKSAADQQATDQQPAATGSAKAATQQNGAVDHLDGIEEVVARTAGLDDVPNDDLTRIKGIGKVIERTLKDLGLTSYRQIASLTEEDIDVVEEALDTLRGRIRRDDWMRSAADLHKSVYGVEV